MKASGIEDTSIAKTIEGVYHENGISLDDLRYMLHESELSESMKQEILANVQGIPASIPYEGPDSLPYSGPETINYAGPTALGYDGPMSITVAASAAGGMWRVPTAEMPALIHRDEIVVRPEHSDYVRGYLAEMGFASAYGAPNAPYSFSEGYLPGGSAVPIPVPTQGGGSDSTASDLRKLVSLQGKQIERLEEVVDTLSIIADKDGNVIVNVDSEGMVSRAVGEVKARLKRGAL
jgi:hypothetical protein